MQADFNDWRSVFLGTFESNQVAHLDTVIFYIKQIIEYNSLFPPNKQYTDSFIQDTLIPVIHQITSNSPNSSTKTQLTKFLQFASLLIPWAYLNDKLFLLNSLSCIFDTNCQFYKIQNNSKKNNSKHNKYKYQNIAVDIQNFFISRESFALFLFRMKQNKLLDCQHFSFFLSLFNQMKSRIQDSIQTNLLMNFSDIFISYIQNYLFPTPIKMINQKDFLNVFSQILQLSNTYHFEFPDELLQSIFQYGHSLITNSSAESQNFGLSIFNSFLEIKERPTTFFIENIKSTNLISELFNKDLHPQLLEKFLPILNKLSTSKFFNLKDFDTIWNHAKTSHDTQIINVSAELLQGISPQDAQKFFQSQQNDDSVDFLKLICSYLAKKTLPNEVLPIQIEKILKIGQTVYEKDHEKGVELVQQFIMPIYQKSRILITICLSRIKNKFDPFILEIINDIADSNESLITSSCNDDNSLFDKLSYYLIHENRKDMIYRLYNRLLIALKKNLSVELISSLIETESQNNEFWIFMNTLLLKMGIYVFNPESRLKLIDYIQSSNQLPEKVSFVNFFKNFFLLINVYETRIQSLKKNKTQIPNKYVIPTTRLIFEERFLEMILEFNDNNIVALLIESFLDIYSHLDRKLNIVPIFEQLFTKAKTDEQRIKVMNLIMKYCEKNDKTNVVKYLSHSYTQTEIESKNSINLRVYIDEIDPSRYTNMSFNKDTPICLILVQVSPQLQKGISNYSISIQNTNNNRKWLDKRTGLINATKQFYNNTMVKISAAEKNSMPSYITEGLRNARFTQHLIMLLKDADKHSKEMMVETLKLLSYLPSDESLQELSVHPPSFLKEITNSKSEYYQKYLLQILLWRLQYAKYLESYKGEIKPVINYLLRQNSTFYSLETIKLLSIYPFGEFIDYVLKTLSNINVSDSIKLMATSIFEKFDLENNSKFHNDIKTIQEIISVISNTVWNEFKQILFKSFNNKKNLYSMSVDALLKKFANSNYFIELFSLYLPDYYDDDSQLHLCLDLLQNEPTIGLANAFYNLIQKANLKNISDDVIQKIVSIMELLNDEEILEKFFKIIVLIDNRTIIDNFINKINKVEIKQWSFVPQKRTSAQFIGLKNLFATCYMNSDLQQLYHIPAFRYLLAQQTVEDLTDPKAVFLNELKSLMLEMSLSKQSYVEPKAFFDSFAQLHKGLFSVNEQQDAQEFLQFFLDDLPTDLHKLFEGIMVHQIQGIDDEQIYNITEEPFIHLPIQIKTSDNMIDAINSSMVSEILYGDNQYQIADGSKVKVIKSQRIKVLPQILIVQLQRFEYSSNSPDRIKINKKFEIMDHICLKELMETENDCCNYTLHGVVVHRGEYSHGHYTSLINQNNNWYKFDDANVTMIDQQTYETEAFGINQTGNQDYMIDNANGYLLFYINDNSSVSGRNLLDNGFDMKISDDIQSKINAENYEYLFKQIPFLETTFFFILANSTAEQLRDYYFNIFAHSRLNNNSVLIIERLKELHSTPEKSKSLFEWMSDNFNEKVFEIYIRCTVPQITESLTELILYLTQNIETEESGAFISRFIDELQSMLPKWKQTSDVCKLLLKYLKQNENNIQFAQLNCWADFILMTINEIYGGQYNENVIKINNVTELFELATILVTIQSQDSFQTIIDLNNAVMKSPTCYPCYKSLLSKCTTLGIFDIQTMIQMFPSDFTRERVLEIYLEKITTDNFTDIINTLENENKYKRYLIFDYFNKKPKSFANVLFNHPQFLVDSLLMTSSDNKNLANTVETFLIDQIPAQPLEMKQGLLNTMLKKLASLTNTSQINSFSPFLHVLIFSMHSTNYPRNKPIEGIDRLKTESPYLFSIHSYSNPSILPNFFGEKSQKVLHALKGVNSFVSLNQFLNEFLPIIETSPDDILIQILKKSEWQQICDKYLKSSSNDIQYLQKIAEALLKRKDSSNRKKEIVTFLVSLMTNFGAFNLQYASSFAKYLFSVIFDVDLQQLKSLFDVFHKVIQERQPNSKYYQEIVQSYTWCITHYMYYYTNNDYTQILSSNEHEFSHPTTSTENDRKSGSQNSENDRKSGSQNSEIDRKSGSQISNIDKDVGVQNSQFFSSFEITPIHLLLNYISEVHRDLSVAVMDLVICICTFNSKYAAQLLDIITSNLNLISNDKHGTKMDNMTLSILKIRLLFLQKSKTLIQDMNQCYDQGNKGMSSSPKREQFFFILNKLYEKRPGKWAALFAELIFPKAKFEKTEEIKFFELALNILPDNSIDQFLNECKKSFTFIQTVQPTHKEEAASQLEKIVMLITVLSGKISKEKIMSYFPINETWSQQSYRHQRAIENIFDLL